MEPTILKTASRGATTREELLSTPLLKPFSDKLSRRTPQRATLFAAGVNALADDARKPQVDPKRAVFHKGAIERGKRLDARKDLDVMPSNVARAAIAVMRAYAKNAQYSERVECDFMPVSVQRAHFGFVALLQQLARAKVVLPRESSHDFLDVAHSFCNVRLNPQLVKSVGGRSADIAALFEPNLQKASQLARIFYSHSEKPICVFPEDVEEKLPKRRSSLTKESVRYFELMRIFDPQKARDILCDPNRMPKELDERDAIRRFSALNVELTPEDSLKLEEWFESAEEMPLPERYYVQAIIAKTRVDSKLRRQALDNAKRFASSYDKHKDTPFDLRFLPLEEWETIFQKSPSEILDLPLSQTNLANLFESARFSYLLFGASDEWTRALVELREQPTLTFDNHFQFLAALFRTQTVSPEIARKIVDECLELFEVCKWFKQPTTSRLEYLLVAAFFEPYPWRDELNKIVNGFQRKSVLFECWKADDAIDYHCSFAQILFPWLPDEIRDEIHDYFNVGYSSTIAHPKFLRQLLSDRIEIFAGEKKVGYDVELEDKLTSFQATEILRDYLKSRANAPRDAKMDAN